MKLKSLKKFAALLLAGTMVFSMAACGQEDAPESSQPSSSVADSSSEVAQSSSSEPTPTPAPTEVPKTPGELLAEQYGGFVETPMDLNGRKVTFVVSTNYAKRFQYATDKDGNPDPSATSADVLEIMEIFKGIEKDYNCTIEIKSIGQKSLPAEMAASMAAGTPYGDFTMFGVTGTYMDQIYTSGVLMDLNDPSVKDIINLAGNPYESSSEVGYMNGEQLGVSFYTKNAFNPTGSVLLFNKELAEQFGLGDLYGMVKDGTWTFDKFKELCAKIKAESDGTIYACDSIKYNQLFPGLVISNGATQTVNNNGTYEFTALNDKCLEAYNFVVDLVENGYMNYTEKGADKALAAGTVVFDFTTYSALTKLSNGSLETNYTYGLLPFPIGPGNTDGTYYTTSYATDLWHIFKGVEKPEEIAAIIVAIANRTTVRAEDVIETAIANDLQDEESVEMLELLRENPAFDYCMVFTDTRGWFGAAMVDILQQEITPKAALEAIQAQCEEVFKKATMGSLLKTE